jgi:hypothetical protein
MSYSSQQRGHPQHHGHPPSPKSTHPLMHHAGPPPANRVMELFEALKHEVEGFKF